MAGTQPSDGDVTVAGNLIVADGGTMRGNLRCDGHARLGANAVIEGDVEVRGSLGARAGARILGALVCDGGIDWHPTASARRVSSAGQLRVRGEPVAEAVEASEGIGPDEAVGA